MLEKRNGLDSESEKYRRELFLKLFLIFQRNIYYFNLLSGISVGIFEKVEVRFKYLSCFRSGMGGSLFFLVCSIGVFETGASRWGKFFQARI